MAFKSSRQSLINQMSRLGRCLRKTNLGEREVDSSFSLNWARPFPVPNAYSKLRGGSRQEE